MKQNLFFFFFFLIILVSAQEIENTSIYTKENGLEIGYIKNMLFDDTNMLWLSGNIAPIKKEVFNNKKIVLQRFNGYTFDTFKFDLNNGSTSNTVVQIKKIKKNQLLLRIENDSDKNSLYIFNTNNFKLTQLILPLNRKTAKHIKISNDFFIISKDKKLKFYRLNNDLSFSEILTVHKKFNEFAVKEVIAFKKYILISDYFNGTYFINYKGEVLNNFILKNKKNSKIDATLVSYCFKEDNNFYAIFRNNKYIYKLNKQKRTFLKSKKFKSFTTDNILGVTDTHNQTFLGNIIGNKLLLYKTNSDNKIILNKINSPNILLSDNLKKDLWITDKGQLIHLKFFSSTIDKFLKKYSIRTIKPLKENIFLAGTEFNGLFKINVKTKKIVPFTVYVKNKKFIPTQIRGIINDKKYIWTNYEAGIIQINKANNQAKLFKNYPIEKLNNNKDNLEFSVFNKGIISFNKKTHKTTQILQANLWILDFIRNKNQIYYASDKGFYKYNLKNKQTSKILDNFILYVQKHPIFDILIGTKNGKLFTYNPKTNKIKLLYQDKLNAGITSVLFTDSPNLWINTFNGIVKFNLKNKKSIRYSTKDGLSNNEMNRYSFLHTKNNYFFVGSIEGLNYFNPKKLKKTKDSLQLILLALEQKNSRIINLDSLKNIKKITLPAENRFLKLEFGLNNLNFSKKNIFYKYKLNKNDTIWKTLKNRNVLEFQNLSPNTYNLKVIAVNTLNENISQPLQLSIISKNYFYKTWWFALSGLLFTILLSWYLLNQAKKRTVLEKEFSQKLLTEHDKQQKRIAKDLHDGIGQNLLLIKHSLQNKPEKTDTLINKTINDLRLISRNLHPFTLEKFGLTKALENLVNEIQQATNIYFSEEIENIDGIFSKEKELYIYRIIQECFNNIIKHSKATASILKIINNNNKITIIIKDNGVGFDFNQSKENNKSLGLKSIIERIEHINSEIKIQSVKNKGTTITIYL